MRKDIKSIDDITPDMYDELNAEIEKDFDEGCHGNCSSCSSDCGEPEFPKYAKRLYAVAGGKGGTGKSTVTAVLAVALVKRGLTVGVLDADIPGSTLPHLFGAEPGVEKKNDKMLPKPLPSGVKLLSFNLISEDLKEPVLWTTPDTSNVVSYFYTGGAWDGLDVILVDMPSGAGDVPLNLFTSFPVDGTIIVTEPGELAVIPTQRYIALASMLMSTPVAYVENKALAESCVSDGLYTLSPRCVKVAIPLSAELSALGSEGKIADALVPELDPVVDLIVNAVASKK
ncbi:MAG: ATPase involved in chromosome partitioning [Oscillospiraceae bacterium]|nr:ATPase involved in chromosome partitioning [Oscillospiraceae bacterium]